MKNILKLSLLLFLSIFAACNSDDGFVSTAQSPSGDVLKLVVSATDFVTDGAPDTRATDSGEKIIFENDDRVGVIILDGSSNILANNVPYKYNNGAWSFDSSNNEGKDQCYHYNKATTYIVYYPYNQAANNIKTVDDLKNKFKPQADQSTKEAYRASDLMVWSHTSGTPLKSLNVTLTHAYASVSFFSATYLLDDGKNTPVNISDVNIMIDKNIYIPYQAADGSSRYILPDGFAGKVRCFYTVAGKECYNNTIDVSSGVTANTRYTFGKKSSIYSLADAKVGDFYCKRNDNGNGYLIPGDVTLTADQQTACIGIVYCTDINRIGNEAKKVLKDKGVAPPHGLVMALTNASETGRWGEYGKDENNTGTGPFQSNTSTLQKQYNNVDGYGETHWILDAYSGADLRDTYSLFYHASRYGTAEAQAQYAAPNTTTGWFIPSMGQWWDILSNLGGIELTNYHASGASMAYIYGAARTAVGNMNKYLGKIEGTTTFSTGTYFWSSSEYSSYNACYVYFDSNGHLYLDSYHSKSSSHRKVRCVFAF